MKIGVLLSGCGVEDGTEIHEAVLTLLALREHDLTAVCFAPDAPQHHVTNHLTSETSDETRNMLTESARIARGDITALSSISAGDLDGLVVPGGFGAATNLTQWAFQGPDADILPEVKKLICDMVTAGKPIAGLCMGPTVIALALKDTEIQATLSVGTPDEPSPYDITAISEGIRSAGHIPASVPNREVTIDAVHNIISAPCYMMNGDILDIRNNIHQAIAALKKLLKNG